ncbi:MAG TPA: hypothetical protein VFA18_10705 [Gemmataceae bacterium]|nr:hypothetical protein [Gemmataceae bacterium]
MPVSSMAMLPQPVSAAFRRLGFLLTAVVLIPPLALAYAPSLKHMPRADQWDFLVDTMGLDDFATLAAHTWSYNRTRLMDPGDTQLFRPVLFLLLSLEKAWFGTDFAAWQAFNLLLHLIVCCLFLGLLRRMFALARPTETVAWTLFDLLPLGLTFFFALNVGVVEQVIYHHLSGYLLFVVLVLGSLTFLVDVTSNQSPPAGRAGCAYPRLGC